MCDLGLFGMSDLIELDLFEIELIQINPFTNKPFGMSLSIRKENSSFYKGYMGKVFIW